MLQPATCLFCKIIEGTIPCHKIMETPKILAFLDINPLSKGHALIIPKYHGRTLDEIPPSYLAPILPAARKIAKSMKEAGIMNEFNILQNNGRLAHQEIDHVHFHIIPKPDMHQGLGIQWPMTQGDHEKLAELAGIVKEKLDAVEEEVEDEDS